MFGFGTLFNSFGFGCAYVGKLFQKDRINFGDARCVIDVIHKRSVERIMRQTKVEEKNWLRKTLSMLSNILMWTNQIFRIHVASYWSNEGICWKCRKRRKRAQRLQNRWCWLEWISDENATKTETFCSWWNVVWSLSTIQSFNCFLHSLFSDLMYRMKFNANYGLVIIVMENIFEMKKKNFTYISYRLNPLRQHTHWWSHSR